MATGYNTPEDGHQALGGNYTIWLLFPDGKWYSPKDVSGLPRVIETHRHVVALKGKYVDCVTLPRSRR